MVCRVTSGGIGPDWPPLFCGIWIVRVGAICDKYMYVQPGKKSLVHLQVILY